MQLLALDTALAACSVAVFDTSSGVLASTSIPMRRGHAEALLPQVNRVMDEAGAPYSALDRIVVTVGPGSFTGLRVGVSAARGIALAASKPAVGVSTLAAFAAPVLASRPGGPVLALIDARNNQFYLQMFGDGIDEAPRIAPLAEAIELAASGRIEIVGTGAAPLLAAWPTERPRPTLADAGEAPDILWVARLGADAIPGAPPKPLYLRAPDARPQPQQLPHQ
jgi:tRNA threonylcarbamoyladenosine biosynthesis protein TsaB